MKTNLTELVFILDRSGSMSGLESDTIGGFNSMLEKQKKEPGEANVTTVLFDDRYEVLHNRIDLKGIEPITEKEYFVRGNTALLDAIGKTVQTVGSTQKHTAEELRADKVIFVIITDGLENASREYSFDQIKEMVERQKQKYGWEFIFLGANIDAIAVAGRFGIGADRASSYHADSKGTVLNYQTVCSFVSDVRASKPVDASWKRKIEDDFNRRSKDE